jgi:enoyl-CoA hydratase/carnithine racemase
MPAEHVARVTLNRPDALNAMNSVLRRELDEALSALDGDEEVRAIILTGAGEKAFSAGGDIHERVRTDGSRTEPVAESQPQAAVPGVPAEAGNMPAEKSQPNPPVNSLANSTWRLANLRTPTIGAINGLTYGGAALLATALDIRLGCERSCFRFLAVGYGLMNATWTLPTIVGWPKAKELLFTGRKVEAQEALRIGLLNDVVTPDELLESAIDMGRQIAANSPRAVQAIKRVLHEDLGRGWWDMVEAERELSAGLPKQRERDRFKVFLDRDGS